MAKVVAGGRPDRAGRLSVSRRIATALRRWRGKLCLPRFKRDRRGVGFWHALAIMRIAGLVSTQGIGYIYDQLMKLPYHVVASLVVSALVWLWLRSAAAALACFAAGIFVDLDHLIDYGLRYGPRIRLRRLFHAFEFEVFDNIFVFLHAWEWILVALVILWLVDWPPVALGLVIGFTVHLVLDQLVNRHNPWSYFLTYRATHRFSGRHYYGAREYRKRLKRQKKMAPIP